MKSSCTAHRVRSAIHSARAPTILSMLLAASLAFIVGCDRADVKEDEPRAEADSSEERERQEESTETGSDDEEHVHEHEVHLAGPMYELGRRFSAIWYAGRAENTEMIHYQLHEVEELVAELEEQDPEENGVDVVDRLESDVVAPLEELEEDLEKNPDEVDFKKEYDAVTTNCTQCHADTDHPVIRVKRPDYNPYPNIEMSKPD